jgi:co-chaperonin GroES (HSP10)
MSNVGVHDFAIPHEFVQPTRDMVIIRMPLPPKMVGSVHVPDLVRDMAQHNVMAGRVVAMGPLAFTYKDGNGLARQDVKIGDWVVIRPFAGTLMQGGKLQITSGWRYVSSFQDVLGLLPADKMPDPSTLVWDDAEEPPKTATQAEWPSNVRETIRMP